jgi:hypothetical protein
MNGYLPAVALQLLGVLLLVGSVVFWAVTGHESALFVGAAMSLIGLGAYQGLRITVRVEADKQKKKPDQS